IGYFGASTGGAAAIIAGGIKQQKRTKAIVSRGERPDLVPIEQLNSVLMLNHHIKNVENLIRF
ncbi:unnamed protein product, partial [Rotaria sp. Silwood1]